jgi:hypothetical protein
MYPLLVSTPPPSPLGLEQCDYLNRLEFSLKHSISSHFSGGSESNPVIEYLRAAGMRGFRVEQFTRIPQALGLMKRCITLGFKAT